MIETQPSSVRFLLTWLGKEWTKLDNTTRDGPRLVRVMERELAEVRETGNEVLVDEWVVLLEAYLRKSGTGAASEQSANHQLVERLAAVTPVDRAARFF